MQITFLLLSRECDSPTFGPYSAVRGSTYYVLCQNYLSLDSRLQSQMS